MGLILNGVKNSITAGGLDYLDGVRKDLAKTSLQISVETNRAAFKLTNSFIDQFEDNTGIGTETNTDRNASSEYVSSASSTAYRYLKFQYTNASSNGYPKIYEMDFYSEAGGTSAISKSGMTAALVTGSEYSSSTSVNSCVDGDESSVLWFNTSQANLAFTTDFGSSVAHYIGSMRFKHQQHNLVSNIQLLGSNDNSNFTEIASWAGPNSGYFYDNTTGGSWTDTFDTTYPVNATGTMISTAQTASSNRTKVSGVIIYKDAAGTAVLGTDLKISFSCNNGSSWAPLDATAGNYTAGSNFSTGIKTAYLKEVDCVEGDQIKYKVEFANQSNAKQTQLHGIGVNY